MYIFMSSRSARTTVRPCLETKSQQTQKANEESHSNSLTIDWRHGEGMRINWKGIVIWLVIYMNSAELITEQTKKSMLRPWKMANLRA